MNNRDTNVTPSVLRGVEFPYTLQNTPLFKRNTELHRFPL